MSKLFTAKELSDIFGISAKTFYTLGREGKIPSYKIGRSVRFEMPSKRVVEEAKGQNNEIQKT